jgi:hypothetical protein
MGNLTTKAVTGTANGHQYAGKYSENPATKLGFDPDKLGIGGGLQAAAIVAAHPEIRTSAEFKAELKGMKVPASISSGELEKVKDVAAATVAIRMLMRGDIKDDTLAGSVYKAAVTDLNAGKPAFFYSKESAEQAALGHSVERLNFPNVAGDAPYGFYVRSDLKSEKPSAEAIKSGAPFLASSRNEAIASCGGTDLFSVVKVNEDQALGVETQGYGKFVIQRDIFGGAGWYTCEK